jgi:hypothetical protein
MMRTLALRPVVRRASRVAVAGGWAAAIALLGGCTSFLPVQSAAPAPGSNAEVGVMINDRGRELLGDRVGAYVERIDGRIQRRENGQLTMQVFRVTDIRGNASTWTGEIVTIPESAVLGYRPKTLSKFKTGLLIGAVTAVILTTLRMSLDIFGVPTEGPVTGGSQQS